MHIIIKDSAESAVALAKVGGSGKKYKKCGLLQTDEHENNLIKM